MQAVHDYLLSLDEIDRDLLVNGILLLFDLVILAMLLPFAIEWWENRKWGPMRQSLLFATLDLIESPFTERPLEVPGATLDRQKHAMLSDIVFNKLVLFAVALTPEQSASVARAVEYSQKLAKVLDRLMMMTALIETTADEHLRRKHSRETDLAFEQWARAMLMAAMELEELRPREIAAAVVAKLDNAASRAEGEARIARIEGHFADVLEASRDAMAKLIERIPRTASVALRRAKVDQLRPEYYAECKAAIGEIYAIWDREDKATDNVRPGGGAEGD